MKLKNVALIVLIALTVGYLIRLIRLFDYYLESPLSFVTNSLESWALIFFFIMLYLNSGDD